MIAVVLKFISTDLPIRGYPWVDGPPIAHAQCATGSLDERGKVDWVQDLDFEMCLAARPPPFPWWLGICPFSMQPGGVLWQTRLWKTNQRVVEDSGVPTNTEAKTPATRMIRSSTRKVLRLYSLVVSGSNTSGDWSMQRCHDRTATSDSRITRRSLSWVRKFKLQLFLPCRSRLTRTQAPPILASDCWECLDWNGPEFTCLAPGRIDKISVSVHLSKLTFIHILDPETAMAMAKSAWWLKLLLSGVHYFFLLWFIIL